MCPLKLVNIRAFVDNNRVAMIRRECQDSPKRTLGINGSRIVEEVICVVDVAEDGGELDNSWSCHWGRKGHNQWMGRLRFHDAYEDVRVTAIQMMIARTETKKMATKGLLGDTATMAKAPEEAKVMAMMTAMWREAQF